MKTIDAQSAVPTMYNSFIEYSGDIDNSSGALGDGTSIEVPITTEIRQNLHVDAICQEATGGERRLFTCYWEWTQDSTGKYTITIEVPSGCICTYRISGNKELTEPAHLEKGGGVGTVGDQHAGGHRHDGNDSHKVAYSSLTGTPTLFDPSQLIVYIPAAGTSGNEKRNSTGATFTYTKPGTGQYLVTASGSLFDVAGAGHSIGHCTLEGGGGIADNLTVLFTFNSTTVAQIDISVGAVATDPPAGLFVTINI